MGKYTKSEATWGRCTKVINLGVSVQNVSKIRVDINVSQKSEPAWGKYYNKVSQLGVYV